MKCYVCNYEADKRAFGEIYAAGGEWINLIGRMAGAHIGVVDVLACPNCGALHSPMNGAVKANDRQA